MGGRLFYWYGVILLIEVEIFKYWLEKIISDFIEKWLDGLFFYI